MTQTRHDSTTYERPTLGYACGRKSLWRKSCWQGPAGEACGGAFECVPVRAGDRFECRRPKQAGGRCDQGPYPDGSCCQRHAPCVPVPALRVTRGRVSLGALLLLLVVLIVGPDPMAPTVVNPAALDAGNLSSVHAGFTRDQGCVACHESHDRQAGSWVLAAFRTNDPSARCTECHTFAQPVRGAHNMEHPKREELREVSCAKCHVEHRGASVSLARVPDYACANCHEKTFTSLASHPPFGERYPYAKPGAINFNHARHINSYFSDPKQAKLSPKFAAAAKNDCTVCHAVESATREVRPKPFAEICATCHDRHIRKGVLVLFQPEKSTPASSVLAAGDDGDEEQRLARLWKAMAQNGTDALLEAAGGKDRARRKQAAALFDGLTPQAAQSMAAALARKQVPEGGGDEDRAGWGAGETPEGERAFIYRPRGHADPVIRSWYEFLRAGSAGKDPFAEAAGEALLQFADPASGPGVCGMCHGMAVRNAAPEKVAAAWSYAGSAHRPLVRYSHAPHLELLDPAAGCKSCHELNAASKYADYHKASARKPAPYESNFAGIKTEACATCHREGHVNSACQVCHSYHQGHKLNLGFRTKGMTKAETEKKEVEKKAEKKGEDKK